jgi:hypothetical protein
MTNTPDSPAQRPDDRMTLGGNFWTLFTQGIWKDLHAVLQRYGTIGELAAAEKINSSYVSRLLRLTLLAPDIVEAILDGRQPEGITLPGLMEPFPVEWDRHRST